MSEQKAFARFYNLLESNTNIADIITRSFIDNVVIINPDREAVGSGLTRDMFQLCADHLVATELFVPAEPGAVRMVINPKVTVESLREKGFIVRSNDEITNVYYRAGEFMAFCVRNDIPINMKLSRAILARILYKQSEIQNEEYFVYMMSEMPETTSGLFTLLRRPDDIEYAELEMNDEFKLVANNEPLTIDNYTKYLGLRAKHQLLHQMLPDEEDTTPWLRAFLDGFYIRNRLRRNNVTINELDDLLSGVPITVENVREWMTTKIQFPDANNDFKMQVLQILGDSDLAEFPFDQIGKDATSMTLEEKQAEYITFISKLLFFWSGLRKIDMSKTYQIIRINARGLPKASTCFYQLKIPFEIRDKQDLYRKLVQAVYLVEEGLGLY